MQTLDLYDETRERPIPVALYRPSETERGWILFSVGFGGGREGYAFLGRAWSAAGFAVAVIEHVGSNLAVLKSIQRPGMRPAELAEAVGQKVREPEELRARPADLAFVRGRLCPDADWVGLGGHSFGSYTCLAALGAETPLGRWQFDLSWQGAVLMSVQPPDSMIARAGFARIALPTLMLTGTRDSGMPAGIDYRQRIESFRALPPGQRHLGVLQGADHMSFAGIGLGVGPVVETVSRLTTAFWTALRAGETYTWPAPLPLEVDCESA